MEHTDFGLIFQQWFAGWGCKTVLKHLIQKTQIVRSAFKTTVTVYLPYPTILVLMSKQQ